MGHWTPPQTRRVRAVSAKGLGRLKERELFRPSVEPGADVFKIGVDALNIRKLEDDRGTVGPRDAQHATGRGFGRNNHFGHDR